MTRRDQAIVSERVAVITGAAGGIGAPLLESWAAHGGKAVAVDVEPIPQARDGHAYVAVRADVTSAADCARIVTTAVDVFGQLDVVFNVAGLCPYPSGIMDIDEDVWDRVLAVNLKAIFLLARAAVPILRVSDSPAIVNVASVHAFAAMPRSAAYAASKGAVAALTRQMAVDLAADGIRVVALAPGAVNTASSRAGAADLGTSLDQLGFSADATKLGHLAEPPDVAAALLWLTTSSAALLNGTTVLADNGLLAQLPRGDWS